MRSKLLFLLFILTVSNFNLKAQTCWSEVWKDDFTGTALNTTDWSYDTGAGFDGGWGNNEKEYYTNTTQNVSVSGGYLNLTARYNANYLGSGKNFTSGRIHTRNKHSWKYGRMEASMKLPGGTGIWPAFWMLAESSPYGGWPTSGEIDIMEYRGDLTTKIDGTLHYGNASPNNRYDGSPYTLSSGNFTTGFHLFAVEWEPNEIRWYVDGILFKTETKTPNTLNPASNNAVVWPWDQDFYMILNLALGGWYSGNPSDNAISGGSTTWTANVEVDYVKVYTDLSGGSLTGNIAGNSSATPSKVGLVYSIPATAGATYAWTVTSGTITAGQGTDIITVTWGTASGSVSVLKTVTCGNATYTLPVTIMPSTCGTMLEDFENIRFPSYGFINGQLTPKVVNPSSSTQNTSPFCAQYIRNASEQYDVLIVNNPAVGDADLIKTNQKRFMFDVYSNAAGRNIEFTLENNTIATPANYPTGRHSTYRATTTLVNQWETLTFILVATPDAALAGTNINQLTILFSPDTYTGPTFYYDNIMLSENPAASTITGSSSVCSNQTGVNFSANNVSGYTYNWTVPGGATIVSGQTTNAIAVNFVTPGNVTVTPTNAAGCVGPIATKTITTTTAFTTPTISGSSTVCNNQTPVTYNVTTTTGATYAWTVPTDATILSGQGTNSINVTFGINSGTVKTQQTNSNNCIGTLSSKTITNNFCPPTAIADETLYNASIYPNPAGDNVIIKLNSSINSGAIDIQIMESTGKLISEIHNPTISNNELSIPVSALNPGLYLIRINSGGNSSMIEMIKK